MPGFSAFPLRSPGDAETLKEAIARHQDCDLLLLDTAGRNPHRQDQLEEMREILSADPRVENHLVLSATTKDARLGGHRSSSSPVLPIRSYVFTKIDETEEYTSLFNQLLRYKTASVLLSRTGRRSRKISSRPAKPDCQPGFKLDEMELMRLIVMDQAEGLRTTYGTFERQAVVSALPGGGGEETARGEMAARDCGQQREGGCGQDERGGQPGPGPDPAGGQEYWFGTPI